MGVGAGTRGLPEAARPETRSPSVRRGGESGVHSFVLLAARGRAADTPLPARRAQSCFERLFTFASEHSGLTQAATGARVCQKRALQGGRSARRLGTALGKRWDRRPVREGEKEYMDRERLSDSLSSLV